MNSRLGKLVWLVLLAVFVSGAAVWVYRRGSGAPAEEAAAPAAANTGRVAFLMEQQWLIHLKLAKAEEAQRAPVILSTGRIVPVPSKRAVVSPPIGGILQSASMPRIG